CSVLDAMCIKTLRLNRSLPIKNKRKKNRPQKKNPLKKPHLQKSRQPKKRLQRKNKNNLT
ncbi:MAG: hypothetical protein ABW007_10550, partial [Chitinophagaceae bacterium]